MYLQCVTFHHGLVYIRKRTYGREEKRRNFLARLCAKFLKQWGSSNAPSAGRSSTINQFQLSSSSYRFQLLLCMRILHFLFCLSWNFQGNNSLRSFTFIIRVLIKNPSLLTIFCSGTKDRRAYNTIKLHWGISGQYHMCSIRVTRPRCTMDQKWKSGKFREEYSVIDFQ